MSRDRFRSIRSKRGHRTRRTTVIIIAIIILLTLLAVVNEWRLRPAIATASEAIANRAAVEALNASLMDEMVVRDEGDSLWHAENDGAGKFRSGHFDFATVTRIQTEVTQRSDTMLRELSNDSLYLPVFQVLGGPFLSMPSPRIPIHVYLIGSTGTSASIEVKSAGINQTVHVLYLDLYADVRVVTPFVSRPMRVRSRVPLAYVVLNGTVPSTYVNGMNPPTIPYRQN